MSEKLACLDDLRNILKDLEFSRLNSMGEV